MIRLRVLLVILTLFVCFNSQAQDVFKTPSGAKYHLANCRMVDNVSQKLTLEKALSISLEPCKICKPGVAASHLFSKTQQTARGQGTTTQCKGKTKKGTRCQHRTKIANGYCFQHNPDK